MIERELTFKKKGYYPEDLTKFSGKKIVVKCDYCGEIKEVTNKNRNKNVDIIDKDACKKCKFKKREDISMKRDGVKNSAQRKDVKDSVKKANLERYGVEAYTQTEEFKTKAKKTMIDRYGAASAMHVKEFKQKQKDTIMERYGVENPSQIPESKEKTKRTCKEKFGSEYYLTSDHAKGKLKEKLGVDNAFQNEDVKKKIKETNLEKYGYEHALQNLEILKKNQESGRKTKIENGQIKIYEGKDMYTWSEELDKNYSTFCTHVRQFGFERAISMPIYSSSLEETMCVWLDSENVEYKRQYKVENKFADFYIPEVNLLIEVDGNYWHCDKVNKDDNYHFNKKELYIKNGYSSLFFREDEVNDKFDIVTSIINNKLGKSKRVYARKTEFKEVDPSVAKSFFAQNHLMGKGAGKAFGLYLDDKLISAIQVKRIKDNNYELSRYCNIPLYNVVGGFSKLIKNMVKTLNPDSLLTFIDRRYGTGEYLPDLGFTRQTCYKSFKWVRGDDICHRLRFTSEEGYGLGFSKLWDCGQIKYDIKYDISYNKNILEKDNLNKQEKTHSNIGFGV
jgi:very-short-patch-repair endonuclease